MRKFIWISLVIFLAAGCGSRKRNVQQSSVKESTESTTSGSSNVSIKSSASGELTMADFLENRNLKITANGAPYSLQYGGLVLTGAADLEFSESKRETKIVYRYVTQTTYKSQITYKSRLIRKIETRYRNVNVDRAGLSFGNMVWVVIASAVGGIVLWVVGKRFVPTLIKKILKQKI